MSSGDILIREFNDLISSNVSVRRSCSVHCFRFCIVGSLSALMSAVERWAGWGFGFGFCGVGVGDVEKV